MTLTKYCALGRHTLFILLFAVSITNISAQYIQLTGVVRGPVDSTSLEFTHVYIKNSTIGTYTNGEGQFALNYPDSLSSDTLIASRVGYSNYSLQLVNYDTTTQLSIYLSENKNYLDEVVIYSHQDTVSAIVKKVLKNFRKNYPTKLHYLEGFYRELSTKGDRYTRLIEGSVGITENSYRKEQTSSNVKIRQLRKSEDYREYSVKNKLIESAVKKMGELAWGKTYLHYNNISRLLKMNFPRSNQMISTEKSKRQNFIDRYDFEISKVTKENGTLYYHIIFRYPPESSGSFMYSGGNMIVNMDDYAITEWYWGIIPHPYKTFSDQENFFYKGMYHRQNHVIYSKIENKYYPTFFELHEPSLEGTTSHMDESSGKKEFQYNRITFMVNQVVSRKRDFDRIKKREALEDDIDLYDIDQPYDSAFWANYNILLLDPLLKPAIEDLEKEKTLEEQFQQDGK